MNIAVPTPCSAGLFYCQGTKERATSAENFLDWAVGKLRLTLDTTSASTKGEAIAAALADRRTTPGP